MPAIDMIRGRQTVAPLTNKSGAPRSEGDVVIHDATADDAFTTTTVSQNKRVTGVVAETIADDAEGRVIIGGYVSVLAVDAATSRGQYLYASSTAGKATPSTSLVQGVFGRALSAVGAAGNVSAVIWPMSPYSPIGHIVLMAKDGMARTDNGCAAPAKVEIGGTNKVDMYVMAYDKDADEYGQWTKVMPDDWDGGTVTAKVHWTCGAGGGAAETVSWDISGRSYGDSDAIDQAVGAAITVNDTWLADKDVHITAASTAITLAGTPAAGELVQWQVMRDISDDNLAVDAQLLALHITYTRAFAVQ